jgi:aryl-alcohol dehydrogenase-like predicted oxidoreductase
MAAPPAQPKKPLARYRLLGTSGLRVSPLCLGAMMIGENKSHGGDVGAAVNKKEDAFAIFDEFVSLGGNFIDTADFYMMGQSEEWIGEWMALRGYRSKMVIATKYSLPMSNDANAFGNHRKHMFDSLANSLKRLRTDYVDVYYTHVWDFTMDVEDVLRSFQDIIAQGKVHHAGISDSPAWIVAHANSLAKLRGWHPFVCYQGRYSLIMRDMELDVIPMAHYYKMAVVPWGALGEGKLTGKYKRGQPPQDAARLKVWFANKEMKDSEYDVAEAVEAIAKEVNATPSQVALAWILRDPNQVVLIGVRTLQHLRDNVGALDIKLSQAQIDRLEQVSKKPSVFPHSMIGDSIKNSILSKFGGAQLDV